MLKKQNGSAAAGFMVGLLVGLVIAVVIAFFVAKVPVNVFSSTPNTGATSEGETDTAAAGGVIPADPNAALYNRQVPAFPASGFGNSQTTVSTVPAQGTAGAADPNAALASSTPTAEPGAVQFGTQTQADKTAENDEAKKAANVANAANTANAKAKLTKDAAAKAGASTSNTASAKADPLADIISAKSHNDAATKTVTKAAANTGSTSATNAAFEYYVQAGAFRNKQDAEQVRVKLQSLGISAKLSERVQGDGTVYRVRSGPFAQRSSADGARDKVSSSGMDAVVVSVPR